MFWQKGQERVRREAEDRLDLLEAAVTHGVANVMVKGHAERRARDRARQRPFVPSQPSDGSWARAIATDFPQMVAGRSTDGPLAMGVAG